MVFKYNISTMALDEKTINNDILRAAERGDLGEVEKHLARGEDVNTADPWGNTPLLLAAWGGHEELACRLLDCGASIDMANTRGQTALHTACERGHSGLARRLVERGARVDPDTDYLPPLHFALFHCDSVLADQLLERGADINRVDSSGVTTLHRASWSDCDKVVEVLLDRGADMNIKNYNGMTALDYAVVYGHSAVVDVFVKKSPEMIHLQDTKGWTRLHKACADNTTTMVRCLLNSGADMDITTNHGSTALHLALRRGSFEAAEILLDSGARVDVKDNRGNTPLHEAAVKPAIDDDVQIQVFHKLIVRGASVDVKNINNETPYDLCQKDGRFQVLVEHVTKLRLARLSVDLKDVVIDTKIKVKCLLELEKMKETKIYENTSLKIVFTKSRHPYYLRNESLRLSLDGFLKSPQALEGFPLYCDILRNTLQKSKLRLNLLSAVDKTLSSDEKNEWWRFLPALVQEHVLLCLDDEDLEKLRRFF